MKREIAVLIAVILLMGSCGYLITKNASKEYMDGSVPIPKPIYLKDKRVNICYAYIWVGYKGGPGFAEVPCEKVEPLIESNFE